MALNVHLALGVNSSYLISLGKYQEKLFNQSITRFDIEQHQASDVLNFLEFSDVNHELSAENLKIGPQRFSTYVIYVSGVNLQVSSVKNLYFSIKCHTS